VEPGAHRSLALGFGTVAGGFSSVEFGFQAEFGTAFESIATVSRRRCKSEVTVSGSF